MQDYLVRILAKQAGVRAIACVTTSLAQEGAKRHQTQPTASVALGHGLTGGALMGALLKVQQRLALKFEGGGPLGKLLVEADAYGRVRGYVANPDVDLPRTVNGYDVAGAIGTSGTLVVVRDVNLPELAQGTVSLTSGLVDQTLTDYLNQSEQIPSAVHTDVLADDAGHIIAAGGLLVQALPPYDADIIARLTERVAELPPAAALLQDGQTPEELLAQVFSDISYDVLEQRPLSFQCDCSWERIRVALISLGAAEVAYLLQSDGQLEISCHYCRSTYDFTSGDLELILAELTTDEA